MKTKQNKDKQAKEVNFNGQAKPVLVAPKSTLSPSTRRMLTTANKLLKAK
ncbi:hypothetical protein [Bacillus sp. EAC]|nr:hypothetical protein [Bacillus sp. EAC]